MKKILKRRSIKLHYSNEIKMVDNYLPTYDIADQLQKQNNEMTELEIDNIINDINKRKHSLVKHNLYEKYMTRKYSKYYFNGKGNFNTFTAAKSFTIDDNYNGCGICRKVCPIDNIICNDKPEYKNNCEFCLSCIHICPKNAIHLKNEKSNKRFINPHIKTFEIVNANKQI